MKRLILIVGLLSALGHAAVVFKTSGAGSISNGTTAGNVSSCTGSCNAANNALTFSFTPLVTNDGILIHVLCSAATSPTTSLAATGWTFTQVGSTVGNATVGFMSVFRAYAPNTSAATITATFTTACAQFASDVVHEWNGMDGTNFVDASSNSGSTTETNCNNIPSVTPVAANDGISFFCADSVTGVGGSYSAAGNDGNGDWGEQLVLTGGAGVAQAPNFTATGNAGGWGIAIKPSTGGGGAATMPPGIY